MSFLSNAIGYAAAPFTLGTSLLATDAGQNVLKKVTGGGQKTQTSSQVNEPWGPQQPYLTDIFGQAKNLYNQGNTLTPALSAQTLHGMGLLDNSSGLPGQYASDVLSGKYLIPPAILTCKAHTTKPHKRPITRSTPTSRARIAMVPAPMPPPSPGRTPTWRIISMAAPISRGYRINCLWPAWRPAY